MIIKIVKKSLTENAANVIPDRELVGIGLEPFEFVCQIERQPEQKRVVDHLEASITQRVHDDTGQEESLEEADRLMMLFVERNLNFIETKVGGNLWIIKSYDVLPWLLASRS